MNSMQQWNNKIQETRGKGLNDITIDKEVLNEYCAEILGLFQKYAIKQGISLLDDVPLTQMRFSLLEEKDKIVHSKSLAELSTIRKKFESAKKYIEDLGESNGY